MNRSSPPGTLLGFLRWYLREATGESAYDKYVSHARREHPNAPVLPRRDFERVRQDARASQTRARCC